MTSEFKKVKNAFAEMEALSPELRECVHEYGLSIVQVLVRHGIRRKPIIDEIVREIWEGARATSQKRVPGSTLDWYFVNAGIDLNTMTLVRLLNNSSLIIAPKTATKEMIAASMATVSNHTLAVTKQEKHRLRLNAALEVGSRHLFRLRHSGHPNPSEAA